MDFESVISFKKLVDQQDECVNALKAAERHLDTLIKGVAFITTLPDSEAKTKDLAQKQGEIDAARFVIENEYRNFREASGKISKFVEGFS